jgi:REP element-mobilizing transposase RayT
MARHQLSTHCLQPGTLYHVTNRGADRRTIFRSPENRLVFLAAVAFACVVYGLKLHAYCLMSNHFHLLIEDSRGMLSQAMSRFQSIYARYFNDARGARGSGHLFGDRFFCEVVDSPRYYDLLVSYILLNPLRCNDPLASRAETYPWSSTSFHLSNLSASEYFIQLVEAYGGPEALLASMPKASTVEVARRRRQRMEALLSGEWIDRDAARCGRTAQQMRQVLMEREAMHRPTPPDSERVTPETQPEQLARLAASSLERVPQVTPCFRGLPLQPTLEAIVHAGRDALPIGVETAGEVVCYALWRFSAASAKQIAAALERGSDQVTRAIERIRSQRQKNRSWQAALWRVEWRLRWQLGSGTWRT